MSAEEAATTTRQAGEAEEPVAPGGTEKTPAVEDTAANDAEASPATAEASEDPSGAEGAAAVPDDEATDEVDELLAVGENLAGMTLADVEGEADVDENPQSAPVKTPDVFDRMGYGSRGWGRRRAHRRGRGERRRRRSRPRGAPRGRDSPRGLGRGTPQPILHRSQGLGAVVRDHVGTLDAPPGVDAIDKLPCSSERGGRAHVG